MPPARMQLESLEDWLEENFPRPVPPALHRIAQSWLEVCAERGTSWSVAQWRELRAIDWFDDAAEGVVWAWLSHDDYVFVRAEGGDFLNLEEEVVEPRPTDRLRVAHRTEMPPEVFAAWSRLFGNYELVQPFEQLADVGPRRTSEHVESLRGAILDFALLSEEWKPDFDSPWTNDPDCDALRLDWERGSARMIFDITADRLIKLEFIDPGGSPLEDVDPVALDRIVRDIERVVR